MLPDSIPSPKVAEAFEAQLRQLELPEVPASLDAQMQALFAEAPPAARPAALVWRKWAPACAALAACAVVAVLLRPQAQVDDKPTLASHPKVAVNTPNQAQVAPAVAAAPQVFEGAVPVGYEYQGSRTLYAEEMPVGTIQTGDGAAQQAYQRRMLLRHLFQNPQTHATYEVDTPQEDLVLENLHSY